MSNNGNNLPVAAAAAMGEQAEIQHQDEGIEILSMEDLLGVPVEFLYRHIDYKQGANKSGKGGNNKNTTKSSTGKPLMTRSEAETFLKIRMLSQEMDVISEMTEQITQRQHLARKLQTSVLNGRQINPWITPLLPLLKELTQPVEADYLKGKHQKEDSKPSAATANTTTSHSLALYELHGSMTQLVKSLQECSTLLWQHSEQNFALADSLWDIIGVQDDEDAMDISDTTPLSPTQVLAKEKQALAELQEHVALRIDAVLMWQYDSNGDNQDSEALSMSQQQRRTQLFGGGGSQRSVRNSQCSQGSEAGEENHWLATQELYTPLSGVCQRLFTGQEANDNDKKPPAKDASTADKDKSSNKKDNMEIQDEHPSRESQEQAALPLYPEASQNTANAASTMLSLFNKPTTSPTDRLRQQRLNGENDDDSDDDGSSSSGIQPGGGPALFDYTQESISPAKERHPSKKRSFPDGEENDPTPENSQVVRASAAHALTSMVNGKA